MDRCSLSMHLQQIIPSFFINMVYNWKHKQMSVLGTQELYTDIRQHRTIASADISGSFVPILQFEKLEIHKVFLRFPNFILEQNLSLLSLAELCGAAIKGAKKP